MCVRARDTLLHTAARTHQALSRPSPPPVSRREKASLDLSKVGGGALNPFPCSLGSAHARTHAHPHARPHTGKPLHVQSPPLQMSPIHDRILVRPLEEEEVRDRSSWGGLAMG